MLDELSFRLTPFKDLARSKIALWQNPHLNAKLRESSENGPIKSHSVGQSPIAQMMMCLATRSSVVAVVALWHGDRNMNSIDLEAVRNHEWCCK